jgi:DNA-binding MarR family transcriptional regulator
MEDFRSHLQILNRRYNLLLKSCCTTEEVGVSLVHSHIIMELYKHNQPSMQQAADLLGIDITTFSRQIQALVNDSLVKKTANPSDKRIYFLSLTEKGEQKAAKLEELMKERLNNTFSNLSEFEHSAVMHSLKIVANRI